MNGPSVALAKPTGVTLVDHTRHLREQFCRYILPGCELVAAKYAQLTGGDLESLTLQAIQWHDAGKKHPVWQDACRKDYEVWLAWKTSGGKGREPRAVHLQRAGIRHEFASLARMLKTGQDVPRTVQVAVAAHHGKLSRRHKMRWLSDVGGEFQGFWRLFSGLSDEIDYVNEFDSALLRRYEYAGPRAMLQLADHRASAMEDGKPLASFQAFAYRFPHKSLRGPQKVIPDLWDDPVALLRAPTGAGKTDAAFLWAQRQIDKQRADRLVIAMPTRFTANSLAISSADNVSRTGLYHSSALYQRLKHAKGTSKETLARIEAEQDMARIVGTPVTVSTLDHLCICLTGTREDHHAIFFNLAHSCVVIDEADFYDDFTQANLVILMCALRLLKVPVLLMSATLPESSRSLYGVPQIYEDTSDSERVRCHLKRCDIPVVKPVDIAHLLQPGLTGTPMIVYANTVQRAQRYYRWFIRNGMDPNDVVLYHSRFTEPDKATIEDRLRSMLGEEAWATGCPHGVAILTQIGEISVNISTDYMLSELCPLDRLVQRVGRLARFPNLHGEKRPGELHVLLPHKRDKAGNLVAYPAPYGSYRPGFGWEAAPALTASADMLAQSCQYSAKDFVQLVNRLYSKLPEMPSDARENQRALREMIGLNWLILSGGQVSQQGDEATSGALQWRCRDIDAQMTVLVGMDMFGQFVDSEQGQWVRSRREWRTIMLEHGINCQTYEFKRAEELGCLESRTFAIGDEDRDDSETAWLVRPNFYNSALGLCFGDPEDEDDDLAE